MGTYLNPSKDSFEESLHSAIYVDKTGLIAKTNKLVKTKQKYICISRPRRFGKSAAMEMLAAYYSCGDDSHDLFKGLQIENDDSYENHINKYNVVIVDVQLLLTTTKTPEGQADVNALLNKLKSYLLKELLNEYPDVGYLNRTDLIQVMRDIYAQTSRSFAILIDEWDCIFREFQKDIDGQKRYLDFLRAWLKDREYVGLAYMTGILPIKKYGTHSALNMFTENSIIDPRELAPYFGFTDEEVHSLCEKYDMDYEECKAWYDGYDLTTSSRRNAMHYSIYNPQAVVQSMISGEFGSFWTKTENYEALKVYIQMNIDGLKDAILHMLAGESVPINTETFINDMVTLGSKDDVMTLLVHLGYLNYDITTQTVRIPNKEIAMEYRNAIVNMDWKEVMRALEDSKRLLQSLWDMDGDSVAAGIDMAHNEIPILQYNNENSLSCTISLAFYCAKEYYNIYRELPTGKGFADICFVPRPLHMDKPAIVIELKWDRDAHGAIAQIKEKQYVESLKDYHGNLLLAGVNYDREKKEHTCVIEKMDIA